MTFESGSYNSKLNCEILYDDLAFEVRWAVAGESIVIQLVAKLEKGEYMSFGLSGQIDRNTMIGGDVVVAWIDHETLNGFAYDYYLDAKSQCAGNHGSCPDVKLLSNSENIRLLNAALVNGYSIVTYQRPLRAHDHYDLPIYTNGSQAIIWAIGPLNSLQEVSYHSIASKDTTLIDFGRPPQWNCPIPESDASVANSDTNENYESSTLPAVSEQIRVQTETTPRTKVVPEQKEVETTRATTKKAEATPAPVKREKPWDIPPIQCFEPEDGIFYAQMGPTGGKRGYSAITGHVGWGISWYINGLLIPEINVVRGRSYTFVVEGGLDPEIPAKYHPFYITDDPVGGFLYKTAEERAKVQVFAGITQNKVGEYVPTGVGRLCNWSPDPDQPPADEFASFGAYQRTLSLVCDHGEPGVVQWTPDENTPDTVYYQCFSHRYLGWKINVHDTCDKEGAESEQVTTRVRINEDRPDELLSNPSIQVETRINPSNLSFIRGNDPTDQRSETEKTLLDGKYPFKDMLKNDYVLSEQIILQDPYLPPPPYQKNFDYQSMQMTEPMKEVKTITDRVMYREYSKSPSQQVRIQSGIFANVTKSYPMPAVKHRNYSQKESYAYKPTIPVSPADYHAPAMHIHIIKHAGNDDNHESSIQKSLVSRPYRHSMAIKKPMRKLMPYTYPLRPLSKISKQTEQQVSGSIPSKSVIAPPLHNVIPKVPHAMLVSYATPQFSKKPYFARKQEESKSQHFTNRVEEQSERKTFPGGFNPSSIVIESGFKPIIPNTETQNTVQERMSVDTEDYVDQDTAKEFATENATLLEDYAKNPFEGKEPELFEPMFIPSPVISEHLRKNKLQDEARKVKTHKPNQNNIVYIWPNEGVTNIPAKDSYYKNNYYSSNGDAASYYNSFDKNEHIPNDNDVLDAYQTKPMNKANKEVPHNYKVTEYDQSNEQLTDENNNSMKEVSPLTSETRRKFEENSNYKIKYIPVGNLANNDKEFVIKVPDREDVNETSFKSVKS